MNTCIVMVLYPFLILIINDKTKTMTVYNILFYGEGIYNSSLFVLALIHEMRLL
jgi:hypothetical protein